MNILFVAPYVPNQIRVRPYHLISELVRRGHRVVLATLWTTEVERQELETFAARGVHVLSKQMPVWRSLTNSVYALCSALPLQALYSWHPRFARALTQALVDHDIDIIHVEHLRGAEYGLHIQRELMQRQLSVPMLWDSVDCISHLFQQAAIQSRTWKSRMIARLEFPRTRHYERRLLHHFDQVTVSSPIDKAELELLASTEYPAANVAVVPNGVDLDYFVPGNQQRAPASLIFSGKMSYHANVTAAVYLVKEIMPQVWARRPEVTLWIVGKDPAPAVKALATQKCEEMQKREMQNKSGMSPAACRGGVVVTGTVPDLRPYLQAATLAVAPIPYGAGIQNKVLEAMACGAPVLASSQATSALDVLSGHELWIADKTDEFAQSILHLLNAPALRQQLGEAGRRYVVNHHSWNAAGAKLDAIHQATRECWQASLHTQKSLPSFRPINPT